MVMFHWCRAGQTGNPELHCICQSHYDNVIKMELKSRWRQKDSDVALLNEGLCYGEYNHEQNLLIKVQITSRLSPHTHIYTHNINILSIFSQDILH